LGENVYYQHLPLFITPPSFPDPNCGNELLPKDGAKAHLLRLPNRHFNLSMALFFKSFGIFSIA
jgi:hypothetical protein